MDIRTAIAELTARRDLSESAVEGVVRTIMDGQATPAQIAGFLIALRMKGERVEEIAGAARAMRRHATRVTVTRSVVDTCGTGGDMRHTFNISTAAAFIAAGAGLAVAKHGNRAMSGAVGGADVLEALGVRIDLDAAGVAACIDEIGIGFLFAQSFHPAMRHVAAVRRELGVRTVFNLLGPLTNPAGAQRQLLGVFGREWVEPLARALARLGSHRALVVHGEDGLDELSLTGPSWLAELRDGAVRTFPFAPGEAGLAPCRMEDLAGGDAAANAAIIRAILGGRATPAQRDIALLNAGAALYVGGVADSIADGVAAAARSVDKGEAHRKLEALIERSNR
ncbi:anthranilate phosphoribosyltransferase [bacterium]|nr:anthranilate phosphoribosyltransferase [bacterium]